MSRVYEPQKPNSFSVGLAHVGGKYENLVGQEFAFKFKGEELPKELADKVESTENCVKIF